MHTQAKDSPTQSLQAESPKRNYPFNCWWVAAAADEVTREPLCRWLLDQRVVLYRTENGAVAALEDRCAHRWAPLSGGQLVGDDIACPYHGFRYNARGICTFVPTQSHVPAALKVKSYPVREYAGFIWLWTGDVAKADPGLLPEIAWAADPAYFVTLRRYNGELRCNYMLLQENLMDLTHIPYLHAGAYAEYGGWHKAPEVKITDRSVTYVQRDSGVPFPCTLVHIEAGKRVNRIDRGTFASPACTLIGSEYEDPAPADGQRGRYNAQVLHCVTPISPGRCHYWNVFAFDFGQEIFKSHEAPAAEWDAIVKQDRTAVEAIQTTIDEDVNGDRVPKVLVRADAAAVEAQRIVQKMLQAESG